jgi:hypothetical protein
MAMVYSNSPVQGRDKSSKFQRTLRLFLCPWRSFERERGTPDSRAAARIQAHRILTTLEGYGYSVGGGGVIKYII